MSPSPSLESAAAALLRADLELIPGAPTAINSVQVVPADELPAHLDIRGFVAPQIKFVLKVPTAEAWTGRLLFIGTGGPGGFLDPGVVDRGLRQGSATVNCDLGHSATRMGSLWGLGNPAAVRDWAWRATHVTLLAATDIAQRVYDAPVRHRYFAGSSTGGRHGLIEAQRFPNDFDGILACSPGHYYIYTTFTWPWLSQRLFTPDGEPILQPEDVEIITAAVFEQSVAAGAVEDGTIVRPWDVTVDVSAIALPEPKLAAVRALYDGPGRQPAERGFRGVLAGSEADGDWLHLFVGTRLLFEISQGLVRHQIYNAGEPSRASLADWRVEDWPQAFSEAIAQAGATDPNLDAFRAHGGKLLLVQPWSDVWVDPHHAMWYHDDLADRYGDGVGDLARLFMIPGRGHSSGLHHYGPTEDTLDLLIRWVEDGVAPERLDVDGRALSPRIAHQM